MSYFSYLEHMVDYKAKNLNTVKANFGGGDSSVVRAPDS